MSGERIEHESVPSFARTIDGGARKQQMYQLFMLGQLMDRPVHGYVLRDILSNMLGPFRQMSWGALYPLIRQLEHDGLIELDVEDDEGQGKREANSRQRKRYRITDAGKERFQTLMQQPDEYSVDTPELFMIKLVNFKYVAPELRLAILRHYLGYLQIAENYVQMQRRRKESYVDRDLQYVLRGVYYRLNTVQAELQWVEQEIARMAGETEKAP
jgi:DNA-binding PadR family transcriptional regulator